MAPILSKKKQFCDFNSFSSDSCLRNNDTTYSCGESFETLLILTSSMLVGAKISFFLQNTVLQLQSFCKNILQLRCFFTKKIVLLLNSFIKELVLDGAIPDAQQKVEPCILHLLYYI